MGLWYCKKDDIMSLKENQATPKVAFGFLGSLANEYPAKQDVKRGSADSWEKKHEQEVRKHEFSSEWLFMISWLLSQ